MKRQRHLMRFTENPLAGRAPARGAQRQRRESGAASLIVVLVLFFLVSLVAAYTSRNLIFEQRTSVNQYRSTQAFEAAEAGIEWALAMLNGGRIGANCQEAAAAATDTSFRQRYLSIDTTTGSTAGNITPRTQAPSGSTLFPSCVWNGANWSCSCPTNGAPVLAPPAGSGIYPAFRVRFTLDGVTKPGVVRIDAQGCTKLDASCLDFTAGAVEQEGRARVTMLAALKPAVATPPAAALTVLGQVVGGGAIAAYNTSPEWGGVTIQAGGPIGNVGAFVLRSNPGTPGEESLVANDGTLSALAPAPDRAFASIFGAWPTAYRLQPGAVRVDCPAAGCRAAVAAAAALNPDRVIWIPGDLTLESAGDIGSAPTPADPTVPGPVTLVVNGRVNFAAAGIRIFGLVYATSGDWIGSGEIRGAAFVAGDLAATAEPIVALDGPTLDALRMRSGSFVRVPGSWRDF